MKNISMANNINLDSDISKQITVHKNISQEIIIINLDKIKLVLSEYQQILQKKKDWINPLSLFFSLLVTNLTVTFSPTWGLSADTWQAIFIITNALSLIWLLKCLFFVFKWRKENINSIIAKLKQSSENQK